MASPTPSLESLPRANSIGSFGDQHEYLSLSPLADSPLSVSGSSPPVSDSVDPTATLGPALPAVQGARLRLQTTRLLPHLLQRLP
ncbi:unnamed protein product [Callosobruchus maculatus]|uniref:Uncharacterized protein n=1 Tax=Callosobruchus maculatus TaxID=64391 RepID=A0A653DB82_CALMS|nr:unnamed protein product [Callosobruchus maculatus]